PPCGSRLSHQESQGGEQRFMIRKERVYILVKTYPAISKKYNELVCTAGILENGEWIRLYPIPFRILKEDQKFPKFSWIEVEIERNTEDFRPETYRPNLNSICVDPRPDKVDWKKRNDVIFKRTSVYRDLEKLLQDKSEKSISLAIFKPKRILDLVVKKTSREWDLQKLETLREKAAQLDLFMTPEEVQAEFSVVPKVPYEFSYKFEDEKGKISTLMISDWEIGMLYFNCLKWTNNDEPEAVKQVKTKYLDFFSTRDVYLFLGTTKGYHNISDNPFIIIGVYYPPKAVEQDSPQLSLFDSENGF
ncbi:MAG TPA: hypothetical protein PKN79_01235, partial [Sphaerochaeta sp.]|nr:hypothetical protein [Sphaerochaeta sp.]